MVLNEEFFADRFRFPLELNIMKTTFCRAIFLRFEERLCLGRPYAASSPKTPGTGIVRSV